MKAVIHLTSDDEFARRLARARVNRLLSSFDPREVVLFVDIDGVRMLTTDATDATTSGTCSRPA